MDYQEFIRQLPQEVQKAAGGQAKVLVSSICHRNHAPADGIVLFLPGEHAAPVLYLQPLFQKYEAGYSFDKIIADILETHSKAELTVRPDWLPDTDFEKAKEHIVCRLYNYRLNRHLAARAPHRRFLDLAVFYYYIADESPSGMASILVTGQMLKRWGVSEEVLHASAVSAFRKKSPWRLMTASELAGTLSVSPAGLFTDPPDASPFLYFLSGESLQFGAAWILFDDVLEEISQRLDGSFLVLPSSIHECLILPEKGFGAEPACLQRIVSEVNRECVALEEVLSDSVYRYSCTEKTLSIVQKGPGNENESIT